MKSIILLLILISMSAIAQPKRCIDWGGMPSFIDVLDTANFVGLCFIKSERCNSYDLEVIEQYKSTESFSLIKVWGDLECNDERENLNGRVGDTVIVAVINLKTIETCNTEYYSLLVKPGRNVFITTSIGNNSIAIKNGFAHGCITKSCGYFYDTQGKEIGYSSYQDQVENMQLSEVKRLILAHIH